MLVREIGVAVRLVIRLVILVSGEIHIVSPSSHATRPIMGRWWVVELYASWKANGF